MRAVTRIVQCDLVSACRVSRQLESVKYAEWKGTQPPKSLVLLMCRGSRRNGGRVATNQLPLTKSHRSPRLYRLPLREI